MSERGARAEPLGALARQARELLVRVRDSRWPGFEPPRAEAATLPAAAPGRRPAGARQASPGAERAMRPQRATPLQPASPVPVAPAAAPLPDLPAWDSLEQIAQAVAACTKCPLHAGRTHAVPGEGNPNPRLLFVGEAPGADEDQLGRPFVGKAGQLLDRMIAAMGLTRGEVFIANVLKCRPPENRTPLPAEIAACAPYLRAQIQLLGPEIICTLGNPATQSLLGVSEGIGRMRGRFSSYRGVPVLPTFHPSYLLRTPAGKKLAWEDLRQIMVRLGLPLPDPSRAREND